MVLPTILKPSETLTDEARQRGLKTLTFQTIAASGADGLASGGFLAAFALILGASNFHVGIMAAIPSIMQPLQIAAVVLVERLRMRKVVAVPAYFTAFASWVPIGLIPFVIEVPHAGAVTLLLFFTAVRGVANAFVNTSWTSLAPRPSASRRDGWLLRSTHAGSYDDRSRDRTGRCVLH